MKKIKMCALIISICIFIVGCGGPSYKMGEDQLYARDGRDCIAYRVVVDSDISDSELREVYENVIENDGYYLHTVWFYDDEEDADGSNPYTIAEMEEIEEDEVPTINRID